MAVCASCSRDLAGEFSFCPFCGAPVGAATGPAEERKVVTCLFCDLVGFTSRAERLDPEDVRAMLRPYHARVRDELERRGGTVEKFIGDAVMAVFGAPVAHEDDPERAVRAAFAIRDSAREEGVELRIGIATGEALVTLDARPAEGEGMASGDVVNTAARLQSAAPVYGVLVGETTFRATRRTIVYREVAPVAAKGKKDPVPAWEAVEARSRFGTEVLDHVTAELVGRERELDVLRSALDRVRSERSSQLVTLVGVPGMGKSRLVHELSRVVNAESDLTTWRQGRCLAYGDGVTFWALAEIVKAHAGVLEGDTEETVLGKLHAVVADTIADPQEASWIEARLRPLAGLEAETEIVGDRRSESFAAWRRFFEALANERTLVAVFEDMQWADDGLLDFVDELSDWASGVPLLLLCTARPELLSRRPSWGGGKLNATTVALSPLSESETASLIGRVLERSVLPVDTQRALLERAEGNPLYAEQFALLYAERGSAEELPLPENLQAIVAARLDALPPAEKALLQDASVVGKVFWTGCLQDEPEPLLRELTRKGFVRRQLRSSVAGEDEYAFGHVLVRDVAYGQIPRAERSRKHANAAEWVEALGRTEDHAEMLAHHWRSALELARAAGAADDADLVDRTRLALRAAGERASALNAHVAAEAYLAEALALWAPEAADYPDLIFRHARALHLAGDDRRDSALARARDALAAAGDRAQAAEASAFLARIAWYRGAQEESLQHLRHAETLVADAPPSLAKTRVLATSARQLTLAGNGEAGCTLAEEALSMARELGLAELEAHALGTIGTARIGSDGSEQLEQALELALAANSPVASTTYINLAVSAAFAGDFVREDELLAEAVRTAERFADRDSLRFARGDRIWTRHALGHWDEALSAAEEFIAECEHDPHYLETTALSIRSEIRIARDDRVGAVEDAERALALARQIGDPQSLLPQLAWNSYVYATVGRIDEARTLAREALALARIEIVGPLRPLTAAAAQLGVEAELRDAVDRAVDRPVNAAVRAAAWGDHARSADLFAATGSPTIEAFHRFASGESLLAAGRREEGEAELERALVFYRSVGATAYLRRADALLGAKAGTG
ncbi:MAG TPA: AAA family ATPase [Gaiellaceae bacterium]|nr:AAA family ATPase [Gaiellaceae bacterium]